MKQRIQTVSQWQRVSCIYNFAAVLQSSFKRSYNRTLDHSGMSHNVAEQCNVETRFKQATENSSNSQETFVEGW